MVAVIQNLCFSMLLLSWPSSLAPHIMFIYIIWPFSAFSFILRALFIVWHILYIINVIQMCSKCGELKSTWVCKMFREKEKKQQLIFMQINSKNTFGLISQNHQIISWAYVMRWAQLDCAKKKKDQPRPHEALWQRITKRWKTWKDRKYSSEISVT